jgi:Fe2+ or Zn2+ uptake regulation protein|tara:strand:+ start:237 stop:602 length:366 start_codon:yes stop_codon:yes gene_type:complete
VRYSYQREIILDIVRSTKTHPTAEWIHNKAQKKIKAISLGTVYRNLGLLENLGKIQTVKDNNVVRYDCNIEPHNHLKCKICDTLIDIPVANEAMKKNVKTKYNFDVDDINITFIGTCSKHN